MSTATQVTDGIGIVSGVLALTNQDKWAEALFPVTSDLTVAAGPVVCGYTDITIPYYNDPSQYPGCNPPDPIPPGNRKIFQRCLQRPPPDGTLVSYIFMGDFAPSGFPWSVTDPYSITISGSRLWRTATETAHFGRDQSPAFSADRTAADGWISISPGTYSVTFGDLSASGGNANTTSILGATIWCKEEQSHTGPYPCQHASGSLVWSGVNVDFSGMSKTYGGGDFRARGSGNAVIFEALREFDATFAPYQSAWLHGLPRIPDFTRFAVRRRDGSLLSDARLSGPFRASLEVPDSLNWSTTP